MRKVAVRVHALQIAHTTPHRAMALLNLASQRGVAIARRPATARLGAVRVAAAGNASAAAPEAKKRVSEVAAGCRQGGREAGRTLSCWQELELTTAYPAAPCTIAGHAAQAWVSHHWRRTRGQRPDGRGRGCRCRAACAQPPSGAAARACAHEHMRVHARTRACARAGADQAWRQDPGRAGGHADPGVHEER